MNSPHNDDGNDTDDTVDDNVPDTRIQDLNQNIEELTGRRDAFIVSSNNMYSKYFDREPTSGTTTPGPRGIDMITDPTKKEDINKRYTDLKAIIINLDGDIHNKIQERYAIIQSMAAGGGRRSQVVPPTRGKPRQRKTPKKSKKANKSKKCKGTIYTINGKNYCVGEKIMSKKNGVKKNRKHTSKKSKKTRKSKKARKSRKR